MYDGPKNMKSEVMLAVEITENDRQQRQSQTFLPTVNEEGTSPMFFLTASLLFSALLPFTITLEFD